MARRSARLVALVLAALSLVATSSCSSIDELLELEARIERQGYDVTNVFHEDFGTGRNEVQVDARTGRGQPPPDGAVEIAGVVWSTYPRRFDTVQVRLDDDTALFTRGDLQEKFGTRPSRLDEKEFSDDVSDTVRSFAVVALAVLLLVVVGAVVIVVVVRKRRRDRPQLPPPPRMPPPGMPPPGWGAPPPPPGPPPGWSPPPPPSNPSPGRYPPPSS